jgi:hypothetical protein
MGGEDRLRVLGREGLAVLRGSSLYQQGVALGWAFDVERARYLEWRPA